MRQFLLTFMLLASVSLHASSLIATNDYRLPADQVVEQELWLNAQNITIDGVVSNDFFFLGNDIILNGRMEDEVWGLANNSVNLNGTFKDDVRLFAKKSLVINGPVTDDVMAMADTILIDTNAVITGSATLKARTIVIRGEVKGNVRVRALEAVTLRAKIGKDVLIDAPEILLLPGTYITGNVTYASRSELVPVDGVHIGGEIKKTKKVEPIYAGALKAASFWFVIMLFATTFLAGLLFVRMFPAFSQAGPIIIRNYRGATMLSGGISLIFITASIFLAMFSVIGLPFSVLLCAMLMLLVTFGKALVGYTIGLAVLRLPSEQKVPLFSQIAALFIGTSIIFLASTLPFMIGPAISMIVNFLGAGTLLVMIKQSQTGNGELVPTPPEAPDTIA
ncbi:MAG: cytoskeletal protein CcmA (bactofilin family) [Kiritimatiellia bacterium]|jgi:cytoskeletal protein CcmA (bactofilin family)